MYYCFYMNSFVCNVHYTFSLLITMFYSTAPNIKVDTHCCYYVLVNTTFSELKASWFIKMKVAHKNYNSLPSIIKRVSYSVVTGCCSCCFNLTFWLIISSWLCWFRPMQNAILYKWMLLPKNDKSTARSPTQYPCTHFQ